jgi:aryl-alcohol dehydrogenase-like predicted oxidoreductase
MVDVAPSYGQAELRLAPWISKYRKKLFLAEKTMKRSRKGAWSELQRTLRRLGTATVDLYQLHAVGDLHELRVALGRNGAIEALKEAKETGLTRHLGITGHKDMRVLRKAIEQFDFDSVLLPVHMASMIKPSPETDFRPVLKLAAERDMSVTAIKAIARGRWKRGTRKYETWYEPIDVEENILQAVSFTLSQKPVATYSLPCDTRLWPMVLKAGLHYKKLNMNQQKKIIAQAREADFSPLFPHQGEYSRE